MAFNKETAAASNVRGPNNDNWKAQAFVNIYLPSPTSPSGRVKIGAIPLKEARAYEAALIKRLSEDESAIDAMKSMLILDFQLANREGAAAALPF